MINNRIYRFRAYDKYTNKFLLEGFHIVGEVTLMGGLDIVIHENPIEGVGHLERTMNLEITQWTGFIDKNKKDIYEHDVVIHKFKRIWKTELHTSIVKWNQEFCCYYLFDGVSHHRMRDDIEYEIIGNLFQNKLIELNVNKII